VEELLLLVQNGELVEELLLLVVVKPGLSVE
jgi:hypothetical protein